MTTLKDVASLLRDHAANYHGPNKLLVPGRIRMAELVEAAQALREVVIKEIPMPKAAKALARINKLEQEP